MFCHRFFLFAVSNAAFKFAKHIQCTLLFMLILFANAVFGMNMLSLQLLSSRNPACGSGNNFNISTLIYFLNLLFNIEYSKFDIRCPLTLSRHNFERLSYNNKNLFEPSDDTSPFHTLLIISLNLSLIFSAATTQASLFYAFTPAAFFFLSLPITTLDFFLFLFSSAFFFFIHSYFLYPHVSSAPTISMKRCFHSDNSILFLEFHLLFSFLYIHTPVFLPRT